MSQVFTCPSGAIVNPDGTLSCSGWLLVDLPAPDPIHSLTASDLSEITVLILTVFATAYVFRFARDHLLKDSGFGRNG